MNEEKEEHIHMRFYTLKSWLVMEIIIHCPEITYFLTITQLSSYLERRLGVGDGTVIA